MRRILDGISAFFNPGDLVGIMGPSGCGKTTLLDLLTGRRRAGSIKVHMNGKKDFAVVLDTRNQPPNIVQLY